MTRYPYSILAEKDDEVWIEGSTIHMNRATHHGAGLVEAENQDEAYGIVVRIASKCYPEKDGWKSHIIIGNDFAIDPETCHIGPAIYNPKKFSTKILPVRKG